LNFQGKKIKDIRKAVLLSSWCNAYDEVKDLSNRPKLKQLAKAKGLQNYKSLKKTPLIDLLKSSE
jgi:cell division protein FtsL